MFDCKDKNSKDCHIEIQETQNRTSSRSLQKPYITSVISYYLRVDNRKYLKRKHKTSQFNKNTLNLPYFCARL